MRYYMTYLVKDFFFVFFGHSAPVLRATKMALGNLDIRKNRMHAFSSVHISKIYRQIDYSSSYFQSVDF